MPEESQGARELRIVKNIVLALPRAARWVGQNFANGVRAGMANAQEQAEQKQAQQKGQQRPQQKGPGKDRPGA